MDIPIADPDLTLYVDGSASIGPLGERLFGFVNQNGNRIEAPCVESPFSAQQAELFPLIRGCIIGRNLRVNIYTNSRYALEWSMTLANRGFLTSGMRISHQQLVSDLLQALLLSKQISVIKCSAHAKGKTPADIGNRHAVQEAKEVSWEGRVMVPQMTRQNKGLGKDKSPSEKPMTPVQNIIELQENAPEKDVNLWKQLGCTIDGISGLWVTQAGQTCMTNELAMWVIEWVHFSTHYGARATGDVSLAMWWHPKLQTLAQKISSRCLIYTVNREKA